MAFKCFLHLLHAPFLHQPRVLNTSGSRLILIWMFPKIVVWVFPPNHPWINRVFPLNFHHPCWGKHPKIKARCDATAGAPSMANHHFVPWTSRSKVGGASSSLLTATVSAMALRLQVVLKLLKPARVIS